MDFEFNGTFIGIYGAKRPGYGLYQIKLDGHLLPTFDASSATPLYNQTLFNATVPNGFHQVQLINAGNTTLDVDYVGLCELYWVFWFKKMHQGLFRGSCWEGKWTTCAFYLPR